MLQIFALEVEPETVQIDTRQAEQNFGGRRRPTAANKPNGDATRASTRRLLAINLVAACARISWARGRFDLGKRGFIHVESWRLGWDGLQGGFCSKYREYLQENQRSRPPNPR